MTTKDDEQAKRDAYLGKGVKRVETDSSLLVSSSRWLNNPTIREVLAIWLLRKNGPDFPVEADHILGMSQAVSQVMPDAEVEALMIEERRINPSFDAFMEERYISTYTNADFDQYAPGTVGGIMGYQIRECGFDITLGVDWSTLPPPASNYEYWKRRNAQHHDFEHIISGGQFNSIGELVGYFVSFSNRAAHLSPKLASALNTYLLFGGMRLFSRALLHYPETWMTVLECIEQGIKIGRSSPPFWTFKYEEVMHMTPDDARAHFGVQHAYEVDSVLASAIFREETLPIAQAAE